MQNLYISKTLTVLFLGNDVPENDPEGYFSCLHILQGLFLGLHLWSLQCVLETDVRTYYKTKKRWEIMTLAEVSQVVFVVFDG